MKHSVMVMSLVAGVLECKPTGVLEFETAGAPPAAAGSCWGIPEVCPEGAVGAAGGAVEPVGVGINLIIAAIEADNEGHDRAQHE